MRLFVALDIDDAIRGRVAQFIESIRQSAPKARWVKAESLHITLKFIGEQSEARANEIKHALHELRATVFEVRIRGCGFFPNQRAPGVFWIGVASDDKLPALALAIDHALLPLGIAEEEHAYTPHLTLARAKSSRSRRKDKQGNAASVGLGGLAPKLAGMTVPEFGSMTAREFFLYRSQTSPEGSVYTKVERFSLQ